MFSHEKTSKTNMHLLVHRVYRRLLLTVKAYCILGVEKTTKVLTKNSLEIKKNGMDTHKADPFILFLTQVGVFCAVTLGSWIMK